MEEMLEYYASCPTGFEQALASELKRLGMLRVRPLKGRVSFAGDVAAGMRACLWSRLASRILCVLGRFDARDAEALYNGGMGLPWEDIIRPGATIAVTAHGASDTITNTHFAALRLKDAICDRLIDARGARPRVDVERPDARIVLTLRRGRASVAFDLSGDPLFKRLPRKATRPAEARGAHVLRPDYAALLLEQVSWPQTCADARADAEALPLLLDLSCAGGGVALEAAAMLADRAPGIDRASWGFMGWARGDDDAWQALLDEARTRAAAGASTHGRVIACGETPAARQLAQSLVQTQGLAGVVRIIEAEAEALERALGRAGLKATGAATATGGIVADATDVTAAAVPGLIALIRAARGNARLAALSAAVLTRGVLPAQALGTPARTLSVRPNNEEAEILCYGGADDAAHPSAPGTEASAVDQDTAAPQADRPERTPEEDAALAPSPAPVHTVDLGDGEPVPILIPESEQFAHRLKKVARLRRKWARRDGVSCYRVYDADLPDYAAAIDLYEGSAATPGRWLVIAEYAPPKSIDPERAQARMLDILAIAPRVLDVPASNVFAKARMRARGGSQYAQTRGAAGRGAPKHVKPLIEEGGLTFAVDFDERLDTGIFLDHRLTRALVREHAQGRRWFLNLFAYTGTATCYAADAGVEETVTVDLSNTYLDWAEDNMRLNGFTGDEHHFVRADVLDWISWQREGANRWDLIFCDPPTFSNSAKMARSSFDVQRDHVELLTGVCDLLTDDGEAIFSCNLRTFKPHIEELARRGVAIEDITARTIPEDFARNPRIHKCYLIRRL